MDNMKKRHFLTQAEKDALLLRWNLHRKEFEEPLLADFHKSHKGEYTHNDFLLFLQKRLEAEGYWEQFDPS
jgi:hypothetical protein